MSRRARKPMAHVATSASFLRLGIGPLDLEFRGPGEFDVRVRVLLASFTHLGTLPLIVGFRHTPQIKNCTECELFWGSLL